MSRETPKVTFERLPLEVRQAILSAIPDLETLQAAVQTGHRLYSAFIDTRKNTVKNVLEHHIDSEFMYDAVMTEMTSLKKDPWTEEGLLALEKYKTQDQELFHSAFQGTIPQAFRLSQFHDIVEFFITDFASSTLQHKEAETGTPQNRSLSWRERHRIGRNLYQFELYCNIFREHELYSHPQGPKVKTKMVPEDYGYFELFAPWENEKLACIRDYLLRTIDPAFEDTSMNVPECTAFYTSIEIISSKLGSMAQGLRHVRRIMEAKTTEERYEILEAKVPGHSFLTDGFEFAYLCLGVCDTPTGELVAEPEEEFPKPWYADFEGGPRAAWYWAYRSQRTLVLCGSPSHVPLREWGYVMWDRDRLEALIDFSKPWEYRDYREYAIAETRKMEEEMEKHRNRARYWVSQKGSVLIIFLKGTSNGILEYRRYQSLINQIFEDFIKHLQRRY